MSKNELFRKGDLSAFPDLKTLQDDLSRILWLLWVANDQLGIEKMFTSEISNVLRDVYRISISRQKVEGVLSKAKGKVARTKQGGRRTYQIMAAGIDEVRAATPSVLFIDPQQALSKIRETETLLGSLRGTIRVCDPYVDGRTLDMLTACATATAFKLLTVHVAKPNPFLRDLKAFGSQHGGLLEVRVAHKGQLHDRYVIDDSEMLLFGTSLNNLGFKQSFVVRVGGDLRSITLSAFDSFWGKANPFP